MSTNEADHVAIRNAGKATVVLKFFAIGLVVVLGFIYYDISHRYSAMQSGIRENAMWSVYQLDREARNLNNQLTVMIVTGDVGIEAQRALGIRYDILYSRMDMLDKAKFESYFAVDEKVGKQLSAVRSAVFGNVGVFDDIAKGTPASLASLTIANASFDDLIRNTEQLVTYTNNTLSTDRSDQRDVVEALEIKSLILIGFLGLIVVALIVTLRKQLSTVRAAGLSFERMARDLESAYRGAEAGNRAKSQFMATMGHEIRTPLNAILGTVELMGLTADNPEVARGLKTIQTSGEALLDIINEILDFSKIEHGKLELEVRTVDVRMMAESVVEMMRGRALDSGNAIILDMPDTLEAPFIRTDATRLRQVILNLMSNAVKFTSKGTVGLILRERVDGGRLILRAEVQDTGIGIDDAGRSKLFLPFSQVDASIARKYGGTGLGLTICKEIIERLGGSIGLDSIPGTGSTFWFEMPVEAACAPISNRETAARLDQTLPTLRILVVEDNPVNMEVATRFLAHLGQSVAAAENGSVAVDMASREHFDLILMDMQMPVMDGIEATARIRAGGALSSGSRIVAMTANASDDDTRRCIDAGMDGFQSKPVSIRKLTEIITRAAVDGAVVPRAERALGLAPEHIRGDVLHRNSLDLTSFEARRRELVEVLGDDDFSELVESFFNDTRDALSALRDIIGTPDEPAIDRLLHTIKGAAGNVGLEPLAALAQEMRTRVLDDASLDALDESVSAYEEAVAA